MIIVAMRRTIARRAKAIAIAPLTSSVVVIISMSPVIMLVVLPFFSLPPIFAVFLFSLLLLSLSSFLLLTIFLLSVFLLLLLSLSLLLPLRVPRVSRVRLLLAWPG